MAQMSVRNAIPVRRRLRLWLARKRIALAICLSIPVVLTFYYYAFGNIPMHTASWVADRTEPAISRGLDFLQRTGTFGATLENGGEAPTHHFFLERVLRHHQHAPLREQMARGKELNKNHWEWVALSGMPGWPRPSLSAWDRHQIRYAVQHSADNHYWEWIVHALYPNWTSLTATEEHKLFLNTDRLVHSADLTHALLAYVWLEKKAPDIARKRETTRLISEVNNRLYRAQTWDARTGDLYNERVAFWQYMDDGPLIRQRWIERILLSQNSDGGWTFDPSVRMTLYQMLGLSPREQPSSAHSTFLALYALTRYSESSRSTSAR